MRQINTTSVAVVGGAGFLGSHLVEHLIRDRNCKVLVVDDLSVGRREFIHERATFEHHDITASESRLRDLFLGHGVKYVFNYAAMPYIPVSFARPLRVFEVNATGAIQVINAAQDAGVKGVLQVSSAEIYGNHRDYMVATAEEVEPVSSKIDEDDDVCPHSSYGAAKAAVDFFVQVAWRERRTPVLALRQFNCVGERETHPYIVPEIISQLENNPAHAVTGVKNVWLGNNSFRDFLYAGDAVRIAVELLERGEFGEVYNLGSETGIKMYDLAQLIGKEMGYEKVNVIEDEVRKRPWEIWHLQSDNAKIQAATNYQRNVLVPLEAAIRRTVRYYRENERKWVWEKR